jgi:hypothetical protein
MVVHVEIEQHDDVALGVDGMRVVKAVWMSS